MAKPTPTLPCQRVNHIMTFETAETMAEGRSGWTVDWTRPTTWARLLLAAFHLLFIVSMAPVLSLAIANVLAEIGWVTEMLPRSAIAIAIAVVLVVSLNRSVGATASPWKESQGLPRNFGALALFFWCGGFTFAGAAASPTIMTALDLSGGTTADGVFIDGFMAAMVATLGIGYVTYRLRRPTDPSSSTRNGVHP